MLVADRYRLTTSLGRGAMGEVWRATDEVLGREVAVKLLLPTSPDKSAHERFRREARVAGQMAHPNVVSVHDFGYHDDHPYLVMELVSGLSLAEELERHGPFTPDRVRDVAGQVAAGLAEAHRHGVIHRDIKPGNLLIATDGTVKIADFGIARFGDSDGLTSAGLIVGTSYYLAPERAMAQPTGPAADMYSLGCVLYQLMTGHVPFTADTPAGIIYQHVHTPPVPPGELRPAFAGPFEDYLMRLLAKEAEDRPTAEELVRWARHDLTVPSALAAPPARKTVTPKAGALIVSGALALAMAVGTALMLDSGGRGGLVPEDAKVPAQSTPSVKPTVKPSNPSTGRTPTPRPTRVPTTATRVSRTTTTTAVKPSVKASTENAGPNASKGKSSGKANGKGKGKNKG
ncbi:serine/threonine-protein kinase [Kribbella deserti]|uniref:non-specific serine/threonine protein kinase n=1 Tax=Kribbella deserti TaxID=1926257 RepID=A0ABV6QIY3_9ACTN